MDGDMPDVFENKRVKANKEHICIECQNKIKKGEHYFKAKGHWPCSGWGEYKVCEACDGLRHELHDTDYGYAAFGDLSEWAQEAEVEFPVQT